MGKAQINFETKTHRVPVGHERKRSGALANGAHGIRAQADAAVGGKSTRKGA